MVVTWTGCAAPSWVAAQERGEGVLAAELRSAAAACSGTSCSTPPVPGGIQGRVKINLLSMEVE